MLVSVNGFSRFDQQFSHTIYFPSQEQNNYCTQVDQITNRNFFRKITGQNVVHKDFESNTTVIPERKKYIYTQEQIHFLNNQDPSTFISIWDTTNTSSNSSSNSTQIKLPIHKIGTYNFTVDWGDSTSDNITFWNQMEVLKTYKSPGIYIVTISGDLIGWSFNDTGDKEKLIEISQWGNLQLGNTGSYFSGSNNLIITATDIPDLTNTTNMENAFYKSYLNSSGNFNSWDVSSVTDMSYMFASSFLNQPLDGWNVSSVTNMRYMFYKAPSFNQSLDTWDVSSVTDLSGTFSGASSFNQPLNNWDISFVSQITFLFYQAVSFNHSLNNWDLSSVSYTNFMFSSAKSFNQPLSNWDVSSVTDMDYMFKDAISFNQDLGNWNVSLVEDMKFMFDGTGLSTQNYDSLLNGWASHNVRHGVQFDAGTSQYSIAAQNARFKLIDIEGWLITDGGFKTGPNQSTPSSSIIVPPSTPQEALPTSRQSPRSNGPLFTINAPRMEFFILGLGILGLVVHWKRKHDYSH